MISDFSSTRYVNKYLTGIFLILCLIILSVFLGFNYRANALIEEQLQRQGRAFFQEIVLTRQWVANHGGVYVRLTPEMEVNPYLLKVPDLKVIITDTQGERYVLKNPALVTREISDLAKNEGLFTFRITSSDPLNPHNAADAFEQDALQHFALGDSEYARFIREGETVVFRYMAPLLTERSCQPCHAFQGYREGDVRGGISVAIPATDMTRQLHENRVWLIISGLGIVLLIFGLIYYIARVFIRDLGRAEYRLLEMASKDFLTGLLNRREAYDRLVAEAARADRAGSRLWLMLLDIDHFKRVNDTYGHAAGDQVLKALAGCMQEELREYDIIGRFGGEEFLVAPQGSAAPSPAAVAERLRCTISRLNVPLDDGRMLSVTVSIGVAERQPGEEIDLVISRADTALYRAKAAGRNRVVAEPRV